jgi:cytochrome c553
MKQIPTYLTRLTLVYLAACSGNLALANSDQTIATPQANDAKAFLEKHCVRCHNDERMAGNWTLSSVSLDDVAKGTNLIDWESVLRVTQRGEMPPASRPRPKHEELAGFTDWLQGSLDQYAAANPNPGRATLRRLNRNEYSNAVRDLLGMNVDLSDTLPADDSGYGFDNIADVLSVSPVLMDRYLAVAGKVTRLAVGLGSDQPSTTTYLLPKDGSIFNQGVPSYDERMSSNLPLDSRGGGAFNYYAPHDGVYEINGYLNANTNNETDRLEDNRVSLRVPLTAGTHTIGLTFRKDLVLDERVEILHNTTEEIFLPGAPPIPLTLDFVVDGGRVGSTEVPSYFMSPRYAQQNFPRDVLEINVAGPYEVTGPGVTPARKKIFSCTPGFWPFTEKYCAEKILGKLACQAYRRPVTESDVSRLMKVYSTTREAVGFEHGVAAAIQAILVSPSFLFLHESDPQDAAPGVVHRISDIEYAARLALFLWSSLPDEELLSLAEKGKLREPEVLKKQMARMLTDDRALALEQNFAGQWLYLRNLEFHRPDIKEFPDFDVPLRDAMKRESEMFFSAIVRNNASILDFIKSDYTFLNERLAKHYGIPGINGPELRRVSLAPDSMRGGLLGQASILTVTSYANHTSVVRRGQWVLANLLAAPPPPAPPDVPALKAEASNGKALNAREQLAQHSKDPACHSCHVRMDPIGLSLEKYDAVGRLRELDAGRPIDVTTAMPDGRAFEGLFGLQDVLMESRHQFAGAFTERLMIYALGRGLEANDQPKLRQIVRAAQANNYPMHEIILGILTSEPFNYRMVPPHEKTTAVLR